MATQKVVIMCKKSTFGTLVVTKWKVLLGETVIGEVPTKELALTRAIYQAKSNNQTEIIIIDADGNKTIHNIT